MQNVVEDLIKPEHELASRSVTHARDAISLPEKALHGQKLAGLLLQRQLTELANGLNSILPPTHITIH
jgi:hypothetical protein